MVWSLPDTGSQKCQKNVKNVSLADSKLTLSLFNQTLYLTSTTHVHLSPVARTTHEYPVHLLVLGSFWEKIRPRVLLLQYPRHLAVAVAPEGEYIST